jgi:hypothetical protein
VHTVEDDDEASLVTMAELSERINASIPAQRSAGDFDARLSMQLIIAEPTTTPSASADTSATCSGVEIPNPTASGTLACFRMRATKSFRSVGSAPCSSHKAHMTYGTTIRQNSSGIKIVIPGLQ